MKKVIPALALTLLPLWGHADFAVEIGRAQYSDDFFDSDVNYLTGAYVTRSSPDFTSTIEITYGRGTGTDQIGVQTFELEQYYGVTYRGAYNFSNGIYVFLSPSYARREINFSSAGGSISDTTPWEFGFGGGAGYEITDSISVEAQVDSISDYDVISVGARFWF